jgi:Fe-S-cluster containining protein
MEHSMWNTTLMRRIASLEKIYSRVESAQSDFRAQASARGIPVECPSRCGSCCLHFVPDLVPVEADRLAYFILTERPAMVDRFHEMKASADASGGACPFWNPDTPGANCMIYPGRPLICRLFGFCSIQDKTGEPSFALCRQMPLLSGRQERLFTGRYFMEGIFGAIPPVMSDFSREVMALDPEGAGLRDSITRALPDAFARAGLILAYASEEDRHSALGLAPAVAVSARPDDEPDDFPLAS